MENLAALCYKLFLFKSRKNAVFGWFKNEGGLTSSILNESKWRLIICFVALIS